MGVVSGLRKILYGSARKRAAELERAQIAEHLHASSSLDRRLRAELSSEDPSAIALGDAVEHRWRVALLAERLAAHMLIVGPSGSGKSYFTVSILKSLLAGGFWRAAVLDPKQETVDLSKLAIVTVARSLSAARRRALYGAVVQVDLFGQRSLPRLNVLSAQPGLDPEVQAYEVSRLFTSELDDRMTMGVRQEVLYHRAAECLIRAELPITVLPLAFEAPALLERLAERHGHAELFRTTASRLKQESRERVLGLQSRVDRVLRLKATRLALGAPDCLDAGALFDRLALVGLSAPQGAADVSKMLAGLLWLLLSHAIRRRPNGAPRTSLVIDEFPVFLSSGGAHMADGVEDLLRLARSKGVFLTALTQDLVSIAKASSSLPEVLRTNVHIFGVFRAVADASWDFLLPITGRRPKAPPAPWEESSGGFLERGAELTLLRQTLSRLPDRELFLADRRTGLPGVRLRTADLHLEATPDELAALDEVSSSHPALASIPELERAHDATMRRVHELLGKAEREAASPEERGPVRRARGKLDIG